jgi:hypothetical protein
MPEWQSNNEVLLDLTIPVISPQIGPFSRQNFKSFREFFFEIMKVLIKSAVISNNRAT